LAKKKAKRYLVQGNIRGRVVSGTQDQIKGTSRRRRSVFPEEGAVALASDQKALCNFLGKTPMILTATLERKQHKIMLLA